MKCLNELVKDYDMNGEGYLFAILLVCVSTLALIGAIFLSNDFRHFNHIVEQCEKNGFVQNETIRVMCHREEKK